MVRSLKLAGIHIALVAMVLRALLPAGWMPNPGGAAGTPFVICTVDGPRHAAPTLGADSGKHHSDQDNDRQHDTCPFAAAAHWATPVGGVWLLPSNLTAALESSPPGIRFIANGARYSRQSPRAPPSLA